MIAWKGKKKTNRILGKTTENHRQVKDECREGASDGHGMSDNM
jgi:hypothetical protein